MSERKPIQQNVSYAKRVEHSLRRGRHPIPTSDAELKQLILNQDPRLLAVGKEVTEIVRSIPPSKQSEGLRSDVKIVGGFVRDAMIGLQPKDIDLEVYGVEPADLEQALLDRYGDAVEKVGKSFEIIKLQLSEDLQIDITIARRGSHDERVDFANGDPTLSIAEAAELRDFSMNNLAADSITGEVIDSWDGLEDMRNRELRITNFEIFKNNPFQVYRGAQFCARLELIPQDETFAQMKDLVQTGQLEGYPAVRVTEEFLKLLLKAKRPSIGLEMMRKLGIFDRVFPEFSLGYGIHSSVDPEADSKWDNLLIRIDRMALALKKSDAKSISQRDKVALVFATLCYGLEQDHTERFLAQFAFQRSTLTAIAACKMLHAKHRDLYKKYQELERETKKAPPPAPVQRGIRTGLVRRTTAPKEETPKEILHKDYRLLLTEAVALNPKALVLFDALVLVESKPSKKPRGSKAIQEFLQYCEKVDTSEIAKFTLLNKKDLVDELQLSSGPHLGFILGEIEKLRPRLITRENAVQYLKDNLEDILERAEASAAQLAQPQNESDVPTEGERFVL